MAFQEVTGCTPGLITENHSYSKGIIKNGKRMPKMLQTQAKESEKRREERVDKN